MLANKQKAMIKNNMCLLQPAIGSELSPPNVSCASNPSNPFSIEYAFVAFKQIYFVHNSRFIFIS